MYCDSIFDDLTNEENNLKSWLGSEPGEYNGGWDYDDDVDDDPQTERKIIDDWYNDYIRSIYPDTNDRLMAMAPAV